MNISIELRRSSASLEDGQMQRHNVKLYIKTKKNSLIIIIAFLLVLKNAVT